MPQPPAYTITFGYTDWSTSYPSLPIPGTALDAEFAAIAASIAGIRTNMALLQRDDGKLANAVVTLDSISPAAMYALGAGAVWLPRGTWLTATAYVVSDVVSDGTATYVCAEDHASGVFADDLAAGKWIKLFDDVGTIPIDGSVTTAKLVDGSVTTAKIGFTALDLAGNIRSRTGLQAGTAPLGGLMHAKLDAGDVIAKVERKTDDQGEVGYQIVGVSHIWKLSQAVSGSALDFRVNGTLAATLRADKVFEVPGALRATSGVAPTTGVGLGMGFVSDIGLLTAYDYDDSLWKDLYIRGGELRLMSSGVTVATVSSVSFDMIEGTVNGEAIGYRRRPQIAKTSAYTLALTDAGKHVSITAGGVIIPANATVAFPIGTHITIFNNSATAQNITCPTNTLRHEGGTITGTWELQPYSCVELFKVAATVWVARGTISMAGGNAAQGFRRFSDGSYEMWGSFTAVGNASTTFNYTTIDARISLVDDSVAVVSGGYADPARQDNPPDVTGCTATGFTVYSSNDASVPAFFLAKGK